MASLGNQFPTPFLLSASGYITTSPALLDSAFAINGSTAGTWTLRDGSTAGTVRVVIGHAAGTPSKANVTNTHLGDGILFTTKVYAVKAGANKGLLAGGYKKYAGT